MNYSDAWVPPWRTTEQARCKGPNCNPGDLPGCLVMACTLDENGWCASCARSADTSDRELRLEIG
jgi:hypothetical protein